MNVWDESGVVCWGVGGGEERCGGCKEVCGEVWESWGRGSWCQEGCGLGGGVESGSQELGSGELGSGKLESGELSSGGVELESGELES